PLKKKIRIANAGGYWGDDSSAMRRQLTGGQVDYITQDFLAEITMSILQKQKLRDPERGYAHDFISQIQENLPLIVKKGVKVISSAGGVNPLGCAEKIIEIAKAQKLKIKVGVVCGDDILGELDTLTKRGEKFTNLETKERFKKVRDRITSANVYLGAAPVVRALEQDCDIIVTGRVTDTGITLAPMIHEFGWSETDWDKIAAGVVAGHIIECGAQSSGGNITDWQEVPTFDNIAYPIVEMTPSGEFYVTKHSRLGGLVSEKTVKEQLLYEMGDPSLYITPDGIARFDTIQLEEVGPNRVKVFGIKGEPRTPFFKVSMSYDDGWKASGAILVSGPDVINKARAFAKTFWARLKHKFEQTRVEMVGAGAIWPATLANPLFEPNEILLRFSVRDTDEKKVKDFGVLLPSLILSGPSGVAVTGGRPRPEQVVAYWPALIRRDMCTAAVHTVNTSGIRTEQFMKFPFRLAVTELDIIPPKRERAAAPKGARKEIKLRELAYARSGDKGDMCNVGVIARSGEIYDWLTLYLTSAKVQKFFEGIVLGEVKRHRVDNLLALNFLMERSLGGGGTRSLMIDPRGKTLSQALLEMKVNAPESLLKTIKKRAAAKKQPKRKRTRVRAVATETV
ncbi:MAG TPA: acyclic terpene utilization AtuA family protein, partial [candidate division Zixibacteria bacterium]|nr:acyclic terpene utilization AtuA family protein [candidate division Zixibacteria bacterium]